jgi:hypothetical protein
VLLIAKFSALHRMDCRRVQYSYLLWDGIKMILQTNTFIGVCTLESYCTWPLDIRKTEVSVFHPCQYDVFLSTNSGIEAQQGEYSEWTLKLYITTCTVDTVDHMMFRKENPTPHDCAPFTFPITLGLSRTRGVNCRKFNRFDKKGMKRDACTSCLPRLPFGS